MTTSGLPFSCEPSATPAVSHSEPGQAGLYATAVDGIYRYHVRQGHLTLIWHALFKAPPDRVLTPVTVSDDEAFFGEDSDHGFFVDALNTVDGRVRWRTAITGSEVSNLFVEQQTVYIETDGPAESQVTVHAFNSQDGTQRWSQTFTTSNSNLYFPSLGSVTNGMVYVGVGSNLLALNATTGKTIWNRQVDAVQALLPPQVIDGVLYDEGTTTNVSVEYAFNPATGRELWHTGEVTSSLSPPTETVPTEANGIVYFGSLTGRISAVSAQNGTLLWSHQLDREVMSPPVALNGVLYVGAAPFSDGKTDPNDVHGEVLAFDATTGQQLWSYRVPTSDYSGSVPLIVASGVIYVATGLAYIYTVNANTGAQIEQNQVRPYVCISRDPALTLSA